MKTPRVRDILIRLKRKYPVPRIALRSQDPFQLLVATILSAQCTDARVNMVTERLFQKYRTIADYAAADVKILEQDIRSTGFYRNKAKNVIACAKKIIRDFRGSVPESMQEMTGLPGVARKTANVVLYSAFGKNEGIAVDTHVRRLSGRLGLSRHDDPVNIERDLMGMVPRRGWGAFSLRLIRHGRETCLARRPKCDVCILADLCPSRETKAG